MNTNLQLDRISGLGLLIGAVAFIVHIVLRSMVTAGVEPARYLTQDLWVPINALGLIGAVLVLLGLPAMVAGMVETTGWRGLTGGVLIAVAWLFFGIFLSLYALLLMPWLADNAPSLVAAGAPQPAGILVAFVTGLVAWLAGAIFLAIPFIRGHLRPRWVGYVLAISGLWMVLGNLVIAPSGPADNLAINLLSNLGPVLLLIALGYVGFQMWAQHAPTRQAEPSMHHAPR